MSQVEPESYTRTVGILDKLAAALCVDVTELLALLPPGAEPPPPMRRGKKPSGQRARSANGSIVPGQALASG